MKVREHEIQLRIKVKDFYIYVLLIKMRCLLFIYFEDMFVMAKKLTLYYLKDITTNDME